MSYHGIQILIKFRRKLKLLSGTAILCKVALAIICPRQKSDHQKGGFGLWLKCESLLGSWVQTVVRATF